jgi:transposase-like protein
MARKGESTKVGQDKSETVAEIPAACAIEAKAVEFIEKQRWGDCPGCVHCGSVKVYKMTDAKTGERNNRFLWRCHDCKKQYTVRIGTVFEDSRIPLRHWCYGFWAACASKKGVSALQIKRMTGLSYKSALFMMHRIRWAMADNNPTKLDGVVEADETYVGGRKRTGNYGSKIPKKAVANSFKGKTQVFAVVQRGGNVRMRVMPTIKGDNINQALKEMVTPSSALMTDSSNPYRTIGRSFASHGVVNHTIKEYVKPGTFPLVHTNTIEGCFSLLKRGLIGVYHNVSREHLHRYCSEFEFRYNNRHIEDGDRTAKAIKQSEGKRLRYREPARKAG